MGDLHNHGFIVGEPSRSVRKFVVSHGWETEVHPCPSGQKLNDLVAALERLDAKDDDVVFLDWCSIFQEAKMGKYYYVDQPWVGAPPRSASAWPYFKAHRPRTF